MSYISNEALIAVVSPVAAEPFCNELDFMEWWCWFYGLDESDYMFANEIMEEESTR